MSRGRKRRKTFLILATGPVSKDAIEGIESSSKASGLDIVDVVVVIGVVVGPNDEGNWQSAQLEEENSDEF